MNVIDVILILFIGCTCFAGYKRGFIKTLFDTVGMIVAFFISKSSYYGIENFLLTNTKLYTKVHEFFEIKAVGLTEILQRGNTDIVNSFREALNLPIELQNLVSNIFTANTAANADSFTVFVDNISIILVRSLSFIITFLIIYVILVIISNFINVIFKLPVLNITNRVFGGGVGVVKSIIILYIIFALSSPLLGFIPDSKLVDTIKESESSKIFYENNVILNYLSYKGFYGN